MLCNSGKNLWAFYYHWGLETQFTYVITSFSATGEKVQEILIIKLSEETTIVLYISYYFETRNIHGMARLGGVV